MMIKFDVTNRWTGEVQFTAEIDCAEDAPRSIKLGLAVRWGIKARANLAGANLTDANLADANLTDANLADANLTRAYLAGANLTRANLAGAYLARANLTRANLTDANLAGANLTRANLAGANLAGAYLAGADLADANLADAKWRNGVVIERTPLQIYGLDYSVTILDAHMQIGCELHALAAWEAFDNECIAKMGGTRARRFWGANRDALLALARADGRSFETLAEEAA